MSRVKLKDISISITDGKHGDCKGQNNSGFYFVSCKDVFSGMIHYENSRQITKEDFLDADRRTNLAPNDILITNSGTIGRMALVKDIPETRRTTFQKSVAIIKPKTDKVLPFYLYYLLHSKVTDFINSSNGAAQKNLLLSTMREFDLEIEDDMSTQHRIATILSRYDSLIENYQKQIKLLEEAAQRLYKEWFVDLRFPGHENTKIVDGVPEGWNYYRISEKYKTVLGGTPSRAKSNYWGGNIPWINSGEINKLRVINASEMITQEGYDNSSTKLMPIHTTILAITGATLGQVSYTEIETCANQSVVGIIDESNQTNEYLYLNISNNILSIVNKATGGAQQHINKDIVNDYPILVPEDKTLTSFKKLVSPMFALMKELLLSIESLTEARDRLLPKLMSGEIELGH
ncbi:MAG: restriction endonuclease subunit S [Prevotellaceae bacterium]|nr:restriction endonuclease subunit S [Prevotellaceae bacterium]